MIIKSNVSGYTYTPPSAYNSNPGRIVFTTFEVELNDAGKKYCNEIKEMLSDSGTFDSPFTCCPYANGGTLIELHNNCVKLNNPLINGVRIELKSEDDDYVYGLSDLPELFICMIKIPMNYPNRNQLYGYRLLITSDKTCQFPVMGTFKLHMPKGYKFEVFREGYGGRFTLVSTEDNAISVNTQFFQTLAMTGATNGND